MKRLTGSYRWLACLLLGSVMLFALAGPALAFKLTGSLTGWWDQPDEQNHGLIIAISRLPNGDQTGVAFWAHYDDNGNPRWLLAQGPLVGDTIQGELFEVKGIDFMQPSGTASSAEFRIGTFEMVFESCDRGTVNYAQELPAVGTAFSIGSGSFDIARLTTIPGMDCTGGITDNIPPSAVPERFEIDLQPAAAFPLARGEADWDLRPGSAEFEVDIESVEPGTYTVVVGGIERGSIVAVIRDDDELAEGYIEFRSPQRRDYPLLDFDPRDQTIEVFWNDQLVLSSTAPDSGQVGGSGLAPEFGDENIKVVMANTGVYPGGDADAELERERRQVSFEVDLDDVPVGEYSLRVDTIERGMIRVEADSDGDTDGELEFRFPATPGYALLDFDPRGSLIEIMEGETTLFFVDFPGEGGTSNPGQPGPGGEDSGPELEIVYEIPNLGVFPQADAKADFYRDEDGLEFDVEIDDVPAGTYTLRVGGVVRGSIVAVVPADEQDDGDFSAEGEIDFSNPQQAGDELLEFTVGGQLIEILDGDTVIFQGTFPNT